MNTTIMNATPSQKGYIDLLDEYKSTVDSAIQTFNYPFTQEVFWLHLNEKLFSSIDVYELDLVQPSSVFEFLKTAVDLNLDPLSNKITSMYDYNLHRVKTVLLLDGYIHLFNQNKEDKYIKYKDKGGYQEFTLQKRKVYDDGGYTKHIIEDYKIILPSVIECRIYVGNNINMPKYVGVVSASEIGSSMAWQEHPLQMMYNRAFTRAVRMFIDKQNIMSSFDAEDITKLSIEGEDGSSFANRAIVKKQDPIDTPIKTQDIKRENINNASNMSQECAIEGIVEGGVVEPKCLPGVADAMLGSNCMKEIKVSTPILPKAHSNVTKAKNNTNINSKAITQGTQGFISEEDFMRILEDDNDPKPQQVSTQDSNFDLKDYSFN